MLFRWGLGSGVRIRPIKQLILNGEVRLPCYVSRTITPGLQIVIGVGFSY